MQLQEQVTWEGWRGRNVVYLLQCFEAFLSPEEVIYVRLFDGVNTELVTSLSNGVKVVFSCNNSLGKYSTSCFLPFILKTFGKHKYTKKIKSISSVTD